MTTQELETAAAVPEDIRIEWTDAGSVAAISEFAGRHVH